MTSEEKLRVARQIATMLTKAVGPINDFEMVAMLDMAKIMYQLKIYDSSLLIKATEEIGIKTSEGVPTMAIPSASTTNQLG